MQITIGNWNLEKAAKPEDDKYVYVRIVANRLTLDKDGQEILPQAFNKATIDQFLKNGIIDWHHQSILGKTSEERAKAIIGSPYDFKWEEGLPVVYAKLTKSHPIVKDSILPHLEAEQPVFGGSVGGAIKKLKKTFDTVVHKIKDQITEINWNHLAIAASSNIVSSGSQVSLVKAENDLCINFSDIDTFESQSYLIEREEDLRKALEMGSGTDIAGYTGADALRKQNLEGTRVYNTLVDEIVFGLSDGSINPSRKGVTEFLKCKKIPQPQIEGFLKRFTKTISRTLQ